MTPRDSDLDGLRDRALGLAAELGLDSGAWYLRMLQESKTAGLPADLGALVRAYWELQRTTDSVELRDEWRRLADALWRDTAA